MQSVAGQAAYHSPMIGTFTTTEGVTQFTSAAVVDSASNQVVPECWPTCFLRTPSQFWPTQNNRMPKAAAAKLWIECRVKWGCSCSRRIWPPAFARSENGDRTDKCRNQPCLLKHFRMIVGSKPKHRQDVSPLLLLKRSTVERSEALSIAEAAFRLN
jgi:hypothetical protein